MWRICTNDSCPCNEHRVRVSIYTFPHVCVYTCTRAQASSRASRRAFRKHWRSVYIAQIGRGSTAIRGYIPFIITVWSTAGKREDTRSLVRSGREQTRLAPLFLSSRGEYASVDFTRVISLCLCKRYMLEPQSCRDSFSFNISLSSAKNYFIKKYMHYYSLWGLIINY